MRALKRLRAVRLLALFLLGAVPPAPASGEAPVRLFELDGTEVELPAPSGETALLLHFFATWCPTCPDDLAALAAAAADCPEERLRVIAVDVGESAAQVEQFAAEHALRLRVLLDPKGRVWRELDGRGLPMNFVWSRSGRRTQVGPRAPDDWRRELAALGCAP